MPSPFDPESWATAASTFADAFAKIVDTFSKHLAPALLTTFLLSGVWLASEAVQTGSLGEALHVLLTSHEQRLAEQRLSRSARMQNSLQTITKINQVVQTTLSELLTNGDGAIRAKASLFHNGTATVNGKTLLKYDTMAGVAIRGRAVGQMSANHVLVEIAPMMPAFLEGRCTFLRAGDFGSAAESKMAAAGIVALIGCPLSEPSGSLTGFVTVSWDDAAAIPADLTGITARAREAALRISSAYSLRPAAEEGE